ncbi:coiled-coil and C2 domain-containing protein 1A-like isoform X2 [Conger conger]|uniref:coiled-coil and C2 domain-containing protein 1A-like isoform X2 n=1 Tax=Conger conger TaxID=82655 RepID=UPI002A5A1471|nr:coiled-coil and C2 domain-containing protein 1A-like isoform X2 [Conger conger]
MSGSRTSPFRDQGTSGPRQMGLLLDMSLDGEVDPRGRERELEAELLSLIGERGGPSETKGGAASVSMEDIEHMAALCMKDLDDEEEEEEQEVDEGRNLENDADLLAELNNVLEDDEAARVTPTQHLNSSVIGCGGLKSRLMERIDMYQTAAGNARATGETSRARRYERGLKTLQSMLSSVKMGKPVDEDEIPPPVATGSRPTSASQAAEPIRASEHPARGLASVHSSNQSLRPSLQSTSPQNYSQRDSQNSVMKDMVLARQKEYKVAAVQAKQRGDLGMAKQHYLIAKKLHTVLEAVDRGDSVDISTLPPPPGDVVVERQMQTQTTASLCAAPPVANSAPRSVSEALQQRMQRYRGAAEEAKSKGDERKTRMHMRIVKQYQDAIRSHKAGRPVNLSELPVPPGCPPLPGSEGTEQNLTGVVEAAVKLANRDAEEEEWEEQGEEVPKPSVKPVSQRAAKTSAPSSPNLRAPGTPPAPRQGSKAQQQLDFLLARRQQFVRAALRSKQLNDMQGAALHLRHAKGLDPMITAAKAGLPVDISKVPSAPVAEDGYSLPQSSGPAVSPHTSEQYNQLVELLRQQHEKCLGYSQQFTHMGNVAETVRFEKLAEECMHNLAVLKQAHGKGYPVPKFHTEERTFSTVKILPSLTSSDMILSVMKGINLPAPSGVSLKAMDTSVRFEFPFPSSEEAQKDKTRFVKNSNSPEFKEHFKLSISRGHRSLKRVLQSRGIKFEVIHKGGLFKTEKVVGSAQIKLESLEKECEVRQLIEVLDGRKPTGGHLEVVVKIREPLGGPQVHAVTERWLVLDPLSMPTVAVPNPKPQAETVKNVSASPPPPPPRFKLYSVNLLAHDKEALENKILDCRRGERDPPLDLLQQHRELVRRLQWQSGQLDRATPALLSDYGGVLCQLVEGLGETVKRLSLQGDAGAAQDTLRRLEMVESEMEGLKRRGRLG